MNVTILGAGVCGLYAGLEFARQGANITILESAPQVGGLAAGHHIGTNYYDFGVHMFHEFDHEIFLDLKQLMADNRIEVKLDARIKWAGKFYRYPLRSRDLISGIPPFTLARCTAGLFRAKLLSKIYPPIAMDAEGALVELYGNALYRYYFEGFTSRYWGLHPRELSATFIRQKMPRLLAVDVIKNLLQKMKLGNSCNTSEGAFRTETLHYSRRGAITLPQTIADEIFRLGGTIKLSSTVNRIRHETKKITSVDYLDNNGSVNTISADTYLSTIPVSSTIKCLQPCSPDHIVDAAHQLQYKAVAVYALLVRKLNCMEAQYTYYRDRIFHRVGEPRNGGLDVTPPDCSILIVELTCTVGDARWRNEDSVWHQIITDLEAERLCSKKDIVERHHIRSSHAYPIFKLGFEKYLDEIVNYCNNIENFSTTGRQGRFAYLNMHSAMRMGLDEARILCARNKLKS